MLSKNTLKMNLKNVFKMLSKLNRKHRIKKYYNSLSSLRNDMTNIL